MIIRRYKDSSIWRQPRLEGQDIVQRIEREWNVPIIRIKRNKYDIAAG